MSKEQTFQVKAADDDIRLDRWFKRHYPNIAQIDIQKACRKGLIRVDGVKAKPADHVKTGNAIGVKFLDLTAGKKAAPAPKPLSDSIIRETQGWVLYKSANVIAINKPAGLAVQGGTKLKDHLDARMSALQFEAEGQPKLVHRLDKDTSGVLLLGRSAKAATNLSLAFAGKRMSKIYWALVVGVPEIRAGEISGAMMKRGEDYEKMEVVDEEEAEDIKEAKEAVTSYRVIEVLGKRLSVVELQPITGRTHQLRVHMAQMGHPIVGDGKYGGAAAFIDGMPISQQLHLHARRVEIRNMMGESIDVTAPLPPHMKKTFKELGIAL